MSDATRSQQPKLLDGVRKGGRSCAATQPEYGRAGANLDGDGRSELLDCFPCPGLHGMLERTRRYACRDRQPVT
jgi:hypothetical protein